MSARVSAPAAHVRLHTLEGPDRLGGETRPYQYPHLYQIQAGDWRISYAVERNRLAILVLEVLSPDGSVPPDPARESLTRKMKVKLLDWPEGSPSRDLPPEELGKKIKIKLLDLTDDGASDSEAVLRVRRAHTKSQRVRPIIHLDQPGEDSPVLVSGDGSPEVVAAGERKVTPLDAPTM